MLCTLKDLISWNGYTLVIQAQKRLEESLSSVKWERKIQEPSLRGTRRQMFKKKKVMDFETSGIRFPRNYLCSYSFREILGHIWSGIPCWFRTTWLNTNSQEGQTCRKTVLAPTSHVWWMLLAKYLLWVRRGAGAPKGKHFFSCWPVEVRAQEIRTSIDLWSQTSKCWVMLT